MTELKNLENPELKGLFRKHFLRGLAFLILLVILIFGLALTFEPQLKSAAQWLIDQFGFLGIGIMVFVSDLIISPIPPDAALFFMGKSTMHEQWMIWVPILGLISSLAGICGWWIGKKLQHFRVVKRTLAYFAAEHRHSIKRFGFWMVVLGALTPLPFSITCWLAGIFKLSFSSFVVACLFRVPRFVVYYWAIFYSGEVGSMLRDLMIF